MQENTQIDVRADTPIGEIRVYGTVNRTQHETSEIKLKAPAWVAQATSMGMSAMSGGLGLGGMGMALYAYIKRRRDKTESDKKSEDESQLHAEHLRELADRKAHNLREVCKGVARYLKDAPDAEAKKLQQALRESISKDTQHAIEDYI